jgi:hypothetical protein
VDSLQPVHTSLSQHISALAEYQGKRGNSPAILLLAAFGMSDNK